MFKSSKYVLTFVCLVECCKTITIQCCKYFIKLLLHASCFIFPHLILGGESCLRRSGTDMIPKARMKTLKMTIIIVVSFVVCWTPYYLLGIWYWFHPQMLQVTPEYVNHILFVFGNLNTCCDPVIYGLYTPSFRADLAICWSCRRQDSSPKSLDRLSGRQGNPSAEQESDAPSVDQLRANDE